MTATSGSTTSLDVSWSAPANTGPPITGYDLQYRAGTSGDFTDGPQDVPATSTSTMIASLQAGTSYQVQVRASNAAGDGAWSDSGTGETTTVAVNNAPVADAGADQTAEEGAGVTLDGTGSSDADSDTLTYAWSQTSGTTVTLSSTTAASPTFTAPELLAYEDLVFSLTVNDGTVDSAADTVTVTVTADNDPPTVDAGADQSVAEGAAVTLTGSGTDPEGQSLTYAWAQTDTTGTTVTLTNANTATASFTAPTGLGAATALEFTLTVSDGTTGVTDAQTVTVTLVAPAQVTGVTAVAGAERLTVRWTAVAHATGYKVQWKSGGQDYNTGDRQATVGGGATTSHTISGLAAGTTYTVRVTATRTGTADGPASTEATGTPTERAAGPSVTQFAFDADTTPAEGDTYGAEETIRVSVVMRPQVRVTGAPRVALDIGGETRYAAFVPHGSGGSFLTGVTGLSGLYFAYTVQGGDADDDGISVAANSLQLIGGTITARSGGAAANLDHDAIAPDATRKVDGGPAGPAITSFAFGTEDTPAEGDTYGTGETITVVARYEPRVNVTGTPRVALDIGGATRYAAFSPGDSFLTGVEQSFLVFAYTVRTGDMDDDGISVAANSLRLNGGTIRARSGGAVAILRHAAIAADATRKVAGRTAAATLGVPLAPTGLAATVDGQTTIGLTWTAPAPDAATRAAVTGYEVEVSNNGSTGWTRIGTTAATAFDHAGLSGGTTRHYRVRATSGAGNGPYSTTASATTDLAPPLAPGLSAAADGETAIQLTLSPPAADAARRAAVTGYRLEWSADGGAPWTAISANLAASATGYRHTGLSSGTTRHYRAFATSSAGDSPASATATATTGTLGVPRAPAGLSATADGETAIRLSWTPPEPDAARAAVTGYKVEVSNNGSTGWTQAGTTEADATSFRHGGLSGGTTRHYRVRATSSAGDSEPSRTVSATTDRPTPPMLVSATVHGATLTLTYNENLDTGSVPAAGAFTVTVDRSSRDLADTNPVTVVDAAVTLTLSSAVAQGATVTVSYTVPDAMPIQDAARCPPRTARSAAAWRI